MSVYVMLCQNMWDGNGSKFIKVIQWLFYEHQELICWIEIYEVGNVVCLLRWVIGSSVIVTNWYFCAKICEIDIAVCLWK